MKMLQASEDQLFPLRAIKQRHYDVIWSTEIVESRSSTFSASATINLSSAIKQSECWLLIFFYICVLP